MPKPAQQESEIKKIAQQGLKALIYEVSVTPKPGLVDRRNAGAHKDMDFFTFLASSFALEAYFYQCTSVGFHGCTEAPEALLQGLRGAGQAAEAAMFAATDGVNTHKGLVFSVGILLCAAGVLRGKGQPITAEALSALSRKMTTGLVEKDLAHLKNPPPDRRMTNGERLYLQYGVTGIRGEAQTGFATALHEGYPPFLKALAAGLSLNDAGVYALLHIMAKLDDTNVLSRHNQEALEFVKEISKKTLERELASFQGEMPFVEALDAQFIAENISPGGSADLLALVFVFYFLENLGA